MAARAHDVASLALRGKPARLNFADSMWRLPVPQTATAKAIRKSATEAAEVFRVLKLQGFIEPKIMSMSVEILPIGKIIEPEIVTVTAQILPTGKTVLPKVVNMNGEPINYNDDELEFGFRGMLANMAQGLLLAPPPPIGFHLDDMEYSGDMSLWN